MIDALFETTEIINNSSDHQQSLKKQYSFLNDAKRMILVTSHRRENLPEGIVNICSALQQISKFKNVQVVYPVHPNPEIKNIVYKLLNNIENIYLCEPVEYKNFIYLMQKSYFLLTDSGGIQEEALSLGKPVLVMRNTTERPEAVKAGTVKIIGTHSVDITNHCNNLLNNKKLYQEISVAHNPYGDGNASKIIVAKIKNYI